MAKPLTSLTEEQLRWRSNDAQTRATRHAQEILLEILPNEKDQPERYRHGMAPRTPFSEIREGDVLAVNETGYKGKYGEGHSVAEFASDYRVHHYLVTRRTPSTLWVKPLANPHLYGGGDLFTLAFEPETPESYDPVYQWRETYDRYIVVLGQHADLRGRVLNAKAYPRLTKALSTMALCAAESERRWEIEMAESEKALAEAEAKVKTLNEAIGFDVYDEGYSHDVERHSDWAKVPTEAVRRLLHAAHPDGQVPQTTYTLFNEIEKGVEA